MVNSKLAIVGSVQLDNNQFKNAEWLVECILRSESPSVVITGGAYGVDTIAINAAHRYGISPEVEWPDVQQWDPPGQRGFKARNIVIAEKCDYLVAIRSIRADTYGSGWTADYAEKLGKEVRRFYV